MSTVVKVVAFLAFIAVAVFLFRKDSMKSLSEGWAMRKCPDYVQADVELMLAFFEPKVVRCEGSPTQATCFIQTTEKTGRKTAPVKNWDCTKQHLSADWAGEMLGAGIQTAMADDSRRKEMVERGMKVQQDMVEAFEYVVTRLKERSDLLEGE